MKKLYIIYIFNESLFIHHISLKRKSRHLLLEEERNMIGYVKRTILYLVFFLVTYLPTSGQNLINNPSFEFNFGLPNYIAQWDLVVGWEAVNGGTAYPSPSPDYLHILSSSETVGLPNSIFGTVTPYNGNAIMGISMWIPDISNFREYISQELAKSLKVGDTYELSFYVTNGIQGMTTSGGYGNADLSIYLSVDSPTQIDSKPIQAIPQYTIDSVLYTSSWVPISFTFVATQAYQHVTIGNFVDDENHTLQIFRNTQYAGAYYFLDSFSLRRINSTIQISGDEIICEGDTINLVANGDEIIGWAESTNPNNIIESSNALQTTPTITTNYLVYGISDTVSWTVEVIPPPILDLGEDITYCEGEDLNVLLQPVSDANLAFLWSDGSTDSSLLVTSSGQYSLEVSNGNCTVTDEILVYSISPPTVELGADTTLCEGENSSLLLEPISDSDITFLWSDSSTNSSILVTNPGTYSLEVSNGNCTSVDEISVDIASPPMLELGGDTTFCEGQNISLLLEPITDSGVTFLWSDGSTNSSLSVTNSGIYSLEVSNGNCITTDEILVTLENCPPCTYSIPNAFSPNGDEINDDFAPILADGFESYSMKIYNRWGEKVFESNGNEKWNGENSGRKQQLGVYIYTIQLICFDGIITELQGNVTLIR